MNIFLTYKTRSGKAKLIPLNSRLTIGTDPECDLHIANRSVERCVVSREKDLVFVKNESNFDLLLCNFATKQEQTIENGKLIRWTRGQCLQIGNQVFRLTCRYSLAEIAKPILKQRLVVILASLCLIFLSVWQFVAGSQVPTERSTTADLDRSDPVELAKYVCKKCKSSATALKSILESKIKSATGPDRATLGEILFRLDHFIQVDTKLRSAMQNEILNPRQSVKQYRSILVWIGDVHVALIEIQRSPTDDGSAEKLLPGASQVLSAREWKDFLIGLPTPRELQTLKWAALSRLNKISS